MDGEEAKSMRKQVGMSQAEFATAIGLSRETVGRMERGSEVIDRRTELAIRYVAEKGPSEPRPLQDIHLKIANILDEAAVRGRVSIESSRLLRLASGEWARGSGSAAGVALIHTAQGVIGMLGSMGDNDPFRTRTFDELRQLKLAWRALADELS